MDKENRKLSRQISKFRSLFHQLRLGFISFYRKTTGAFNNYFNSSWKTDLSKTNYLTLASGAEWACKSESNWVLRKTNGAEKEAVIREFFDYKRFPRWITIDNCMDQIIWLRQMTALVELGLSLPVEYLNSPAPTKNSQSNQESFSVSKEE